MIARLNISALLLGLLILTIASVPGSARADLVAVASNSAPHDQHQHHTDHAKRAAAQAEHAATGMSGHDHDHRDNRQSCWDYCADILATTLRVASSRKSDVSLQPNTEPWVFSGQLRDLLATSTQVSANRNPPSVFRDHRTGVSRILRTSMRLRN